MMRFFMLCAALLMLVSATPAFAQISSDASSVWINAWLKMTPEQQKDITAKMAAAQKAQADLMELLPPDQRSAKGPELTKAYEALTPEKKRMFDAQAMIVKDASIDLMMTAKANGLNLGF